MERFDNTLYILLPEWNVDDERMLPKKIMYSDQISNLIPIHDKYFCALDFTPNGNYGRLYEEYKSVDFKWLKTEANGSWWNCIFADFDIKDYNKWWSLDDYWNIIYQNLSYLGLQNFTFVTKSWGWYHIYWVFDEELKSAASTIDILWIWKHLVESLSDLWCDKQVCTISRSMRYPWSYHYKTGEQIKTMMCSVSDDWLLIPYEDHRAKFITMKHMRHAERYIQQSETQLLPQRFRTSVSLKEILDILPEYELRWFKIYYNWEETNWYRYCSKWDYAVDFSGRWRPQWPWMPFLFQHFNRDLEAIDKFLLDNFWIKSSDIKWDILYQCWDSNWTYYVDKNWSFLQTTSKDWEIKDIKITSWQIIPLSRNTNSDWFYYYTRKLNWSIVKLPALLDARDFDKKFWPSNVVCIWSPMIVKRWIDLISCSKEIANKVREADSWYFHNWVYIENQLAYWTPSDKIDSEWIFELREWQHITPRELFEIMSRYWWKKNVALSLCWFLNLYAMNLAWDALIKPSLFITGKTWTGKTTLMQLMKSAMWLLPRHNELSINMVTPQPLTMWVMDWQPLYLEEYTDTMHPKVDAILRNTMNWWKHKVWVSAGQNIEVVAKSSLCIVWEQRPTSESVVNRLIMVMLTKRERPEWSAITSKDYQYRIRKYVFDKYLEVWKWYQSIVEHYKDSLVWQFPDERSKDVYSFLFAANKLFDVCEEEELKWYILQTLDSTWLWFWVHIEDQTAENRLLSRIHMWEMRWIAPRHWVIQLFWRHQNLYVDIVNELNEYNALKNFTISQEWLVLEFLDSPMWEVVYQALISKSWNNVRLAYDY